MLNFFTDKELLKENLYNPTLIMLYLTIFLLLFLHNDHNPVVHF